jgi:hypothetical protein
LAAILILSRQVQDDLATTAKDDTLWQDLHDDDKTCMQSSYWELILENGQ